MNTKLIAFTLLICVFMFNYTYGKTKVSLQKAFGKKYITAKAVCKGGLELDYSVTNILKDSLLVFIPSGWRFN
jgi:hypothetical protein